MSINTWAGQGWNPSVPWARRGGSTFCPWSSPTAGTGRQAQATFDGATYDVPHPMFVTGIDVRVGAVTVAGTAVVALYQSRTDSDAICQLLGVFSGLVNVANVNQTFTGQAAFIGQARRLQVLWGTPTVGSNFQLTCAAGANVFVYNAGILSGRVPGAYTTSTPVSLTPPAILNLGATTGVSTPAGITGLALSLRLR